MFKVIKRIPRRGLCTSSLTGPNSAAEVRKRFIDYFENEHDHVFIPSSPVVVLNDPTIPFVNSGMFQFKDVFLGLSNPEFTRVVNSQKCIRLKREAAGLNNIGKDGTHHTFFEMLGNWSFGDYYKKKACLMAWDFLTENCGLSRDRLYVTYFQGSTELGLEPDTETPAIWAEIGVPKDRILPFGKSDNFWQMSNTGPCGPCTEIHYDHFPGKFNSSHLVNSKSPLMTEIWNLVFMEYNRTEEGFEKLERHYVDTGMGLERLVSVLQGAISNYETDIFRPLYAVIREMSGHVGYTGSYDRNEMDVAYRALADYSRMITVALSDDLTPSRSGRLRTVLRNAFHLSKNVFRVESGLVQELSKWVTEYLSLAYPEVAKNADKVQFIISEEEKKFAQLEKFRKDEKETFFKNHPQFQGLRQLKSDISWDIKGCYIYLIDKIKAGAQEIDAWDAWRIIDTYGISKEGIRDIAKILGLGFDMNELEEYITEVVNNKITGYRKKFNENIAARSQQISNLPVITTKVTTDLLNYKNVEINVNGECCGNELPVKVIGIVVDGNYVSNMEGVNISTVNELGVIFDETNFIPSSNSFCGDSGMCLIGGLTLQINRCTMMRNNVVVHYISINPEILSSLSVGLEGKLILDFEKRTHRISNATGQLLLQAVLNKNFKNLYHLHSYANQYQFRITYDSYDRISLNAEVMLKLENEVIDLMKKGGSIERETFDVKEMRGRNDIIIKPGQTFLSTKVPVCKLTTPDFSLRFYYPYPVFPDISMIENFVILRYGHKGKDSRKIYITGVTGKSAAQVQEKKKEILSTWFSFRNFHLAEFKDSKTVSETLDLIEAFGKHISEKDVPLYLKLTILNEIKDKLSHLRQIARDEVRFDRRIQPPKTKKL